VSGGVNEQGPVLGKEERHLSRERCWGGGVFLALSHILLGEERRGARGGVGEQGTVQRRTRERRKGETRSDRRREENGGTRTDSVKRAKGGAETRPRNEQGRHG